MMEILFDNFKLPSRRTDLISKPPLPYGVYVIAGDELGNNHGFINAFFAQFCLSLLILLSIYRKDKIS